MINSFENLSKNTSDLTDLYIIAKDENNQSMIDELTKNIKDLKKIAKENEIKCFLSNEVDPLDCYIEIHAGAGGLKVKTGLIC